MTTTLDSRERAIEAAFRHDQDMAFRIRTRRDRLLSFWIAELIGLKGDAADIYARDLVAAGVEQRLVSAVTRTVRRDLEAHGIKLSAHRLGRKMDALGRLARHRSWMKPDLTPRNESDARWTSRHRGGRSPRPRRPGTPKLRAFAP